MMAMLPATAYSQQGPSPNKSPWERSAEQKRKDAEVDQAYKDAIKATKDKGQAAPTAIDPWQTVRPAATDNAKR
jgi:hypothetical protein